MIDKEKLRAVATITLSAVQDYVSVRGNAMASGDDAYDKEVEDGIITELEAGNEWAWAAVTVCAEYAGVEGLAYLGGCSYADAKDFREHSGYYSDMVEEALSELANDLNRTHDQLEALK